MAKWTFSTDFFPIVVAHRGASSDRPENTLEAFGAALEAGAQAVEMDVRLTADGVPVVLHDPDVSRVTDGKGLVSELGLAELKRLDASGGRGPSVEIPTLREVLDLVSGRAGVDLEIKNIPGEPAFDPRQPGLIAALGALDSAGFIGPVLISSFNPATIARSRELEPDVPTGLLTPARVRPAEALALVREEGHPWVLPAAEALKSAGAAFVEEAHEGGVRVGTWVVDEAAEMELLFGWGVDAVATNDPATAVAVRHGRLGA